MVQRVSAVTRAAVGRRIPAGTWPCSSCDVDYDVREGWKVTYETPLEASYEVLVCADCAEQARGVLRAHRTPRTGD